MSISNQIKKDAQILKKCVGNKPNFNGLLLLANVSLTYYHTVGVVSLGHNQPTNHVEQTNQIKHKIKIDSSVKKCYNCRVMKTPLWRIINSKIYCNACGLKKTRNKK